MALIKKYISILLSTLLVLFSLCVLSVLAIGSTNKDFLIQDGVLVSYTGESDPLKMVEIPSDLGITIIGKEAFSNAVLGSVVIPKGVTTIEENAFVSCTNLTAIKLPSTLTTIKDNAFLNCDSLSKIYLPSSVTELGENIFEKSNSSEAFTIWSSGEATIAEYATEYGYNYVNTYNVTEFGFYISENERWIPIYTPSSSGHFFKDGYTLLEGGEIIDTLPPYLEWTSDNEDIVSVDFGLIVWNGEGEAIIKVTDPTTETYSEFKLVVYYVETEAIQAGETKNATISIGEAATYVFSPFESGKYEISSSSATGTIYFMISDTAGNSLVYGYDSLDYDFSAGETYIVEAYNLGESEIKCSVLVKGEEFTCTITSTDGGIATGGGIYQKGDMALIQAIPNEGYMFEGWYENDQKISEATANYILSISADRTLKAKFVPYNFEVTDIVIEGTDSKGGTLSVTANVIGGSGTLKYAFYIYGNGKIYYANQNSSTPTFSCETMSAGTYNVVVYSLDETGKKVSYSKQFTTA